MDETLTDDRSLVGDACHIVAASADGPRGASDLTPDQRDYYGNLILLCKVHHKVVDDQYNEYTVDRLHSMKAQHEQWVTESLDGFDAARQRDNEAYASIVQEWSRRCDLDHWHDWTSHLLGADHPRLDRSISVQLDDVRGWLFSRVWSDRCADLEAAFNNFRAVLEDFQMVFGRHSVANGNQLATRKFYQIDAWDEERYFRLLAEYDHHVGLVQDLLLELTRAANLVCDVVRLRVDPVFRLAQGVLVVEAGPMQDMRFHRLRPEYRQVERIARPYPGLAEFETTVRFQRDFNLAGAAQDR